MSRLYVFVRRVPRVMFGLAGLAGRAAGGRAAEPSVALDRLQSNRHVLAPRPARCCESGALMLNTRARTHTHTTPTHARTQPLSASSRAPAVLWLHSRHHATYNMQRRLRRAAQARVRGTSCSAAASAGCSSRLIPTGQPYDWLTRRHVRPRIAWAERRGVSRRSVRRVCTDSSAESSMKTGAQHAACNMRHTTCNVQAATFTYDMQRTSRFRCTEQ